MQKGLDEVIKRLVSEKQHIGNGDKLVALQKLLDLIFQDLMNSIGIDQHLLNGKPKSYAALLTRIATRTSWVCQHAWVTWGK